MISKPASVGAWRVDFVCHVAYCCCSEPGIKVCRWLREISTCFCSTVLPGPTQVQNIQTFVSFSISVYRHSADMHFSPAKLEKNFRRLPPPFPLELSVTRSLSFLTALSRPLFHLQSLKFEVVLRRPQPFNMPSSLLVRIRTPEISSRVMAILANVRNFHTHRIKIVACARKVGQFRMERARGKER